jgi:K+-transporting ATPase A subunit
MNTAEQINAVVNNLSEKLGVAANSLYPVLIKQAKIDAITMGFWMGLFAVMCLVVLVAWVVCAMKKFEIYVFDEDDVIWFLSLVTTIIAVITFVAWSVCLNEFITCIVNPEYRALQQILQQIPR